MKIKLILSQIKKKVNNKLGILFRIDKNNINRKRRELIT